jgi:hypothetical protein
MESFTKLKARENRYDLPAENDSFGSSRIEYRIDY